MKNKKDKAKVGRPKLADEKTKSSAIISLLLSGAMILVLVVFGYFVLFNKNINNIKGVAKITNYYRHVGWGTIKAMQLKDISSNNNEREIKIKLSKENIGSAVKRVKLVVCRSLNECKVPNVEENSKKWGEPIFEFDITNKDTMVSIKQFYDNKNYISNTYYGLITTFSSKNDKDKLKSWIIEYTINNEKKDSEGYYRLKRSSTLSSKFYGDSIKTTTKKKNTTKKTKKNEKLKIETKKIMLEKDDTTIVSLGEINNSKNYDNSIVSYEKGKLKGLKVGKTNISIETKNVIYKYTVVVVPNKKMLNFSNKAAKKITEVEAKSSVTGKIVTIQNFYVGSKYYYFSYPEIGNYACTDKNASNYSKNNFVASNIIMRCEKDDCNNTRKYMYFNNAGHGQQFDMYSDSENIYLLINSKGYEKIFGNNYSSNKCSNNNKIKYNAASKYFYVLNISEKANNSNFLKYTFKNLTSAKTDAIDLKNMSTFANKGLGGNADISVDAANGLMATRVGRTIYIYKMKYEGEKMIIPTKCNNDSCELDDSYLLNKFVVDKSKPGDNKGFQDILINDGYVYILCSGSHKADGTNSKAYIYTYDMLGNQKKNTKIINQSAINKESEALAYRKGEGLFFIATYRKNQSTNSKTNAIFKIELEK